MGKTWYLGIGLIALAGIFVWRLSTQPPLAIPLKAPPKTSDERALIWWSEPTRDGQGEYTVVRLDTWSPAYQINLLVNPPPANAAEEANARLESPMTMARVGNFLVGINATPYTLPDKSPAQSESWKTFIPGVAVTLRGFAQPRGGPKIGSGPAAPPYPILWQSPEGKVDFTVNAASQDAVWALSAYHWLVRDGQIGNSIHQYSDLNYRSAAGASRDGRWFYLIVCGAPEAGDGQGVSFIEMAQYLIDLGVENALNLDGGSSTSLIIRQSNDWLIRPSPKRFIARPNPVMLGIHAAR